MGDRLCPSEEVLSEYLSGCLPAEKIEETEKHLVSCGECGKLLFEARDVLRTEEARAWISSLTVWFRARKYASGALISIILSFVIHGYFLQFIAIAVIFGYKYVSDGRAIRLSSRKEMAGRNFNSSERIKKKA
ncbi:MAG: hypothetical protein HQL30_00860 [Candidatus Omnitrophica bacterium]|nr:hypothetical protein [Candidatus Omnitrophota bacterium]